MSCGGFILYIENTRPKKERVQIIVFIIVLFLAGDVFFNLVKSGNKGVVFAYIGNAYAC